jgi:hypothetical protein
VKTRRRTPAELAAEAVAHAEAHADAWGDNAAPRRPKLGHTADCPNNGRPMRRCGLCRAEQLGAHGTRPAAVGAVAVRAYLNAQRDPEPEERACTRCYAPTVHPSGLCGRCQPGGTT